MSFSIDFPFILTLLVFISGIVSLIDLLFWRKQRKAKGKKEPWPVEYARSFFPILLIVWVIRSFIVQPYRVPTGSLEPTVMAGDFIVVNQFAYGLRFPIANIKLWSIGEPKRGDIALFRYPVDPAVTFVKRIIGLPGDHIVYKNKVLYINGQEISQKFIEQAFDIEPNMPVIPVDKKEENLMGLKHEIYVWPHGGETKDVDVIVPSDHYFAMGDNRDNSDDSRMWGFVPEKNFIGKAFLVWMSWDATLHRVRWHRIGTWLH